MRSFEIFLHPEAETFAPQRRRQEARGTRALLDVFVRGANVTARVADGQALSALVDVATATLFLTSRPSAKRIVHFHDEACELCLERDGERAFLSVYRTGAAPEVYVYDRELPFADVVHGVRESVVRVLEQEAKPAANRTAEQAGEFRDVPRSGVIRKSATSALCAELGALLERFDRLEVPADGHDLPPATCEVAAIEAPRDLPVAFTADLSLRVRDERAVERGHAEVSDFHALLVPGDVRAELGGRSVRLGKLHPFLFAETLLTLASRLFEAWQRGRAAHERLDSGQRAGYSGSLDAGGLMIGARLSGDKLALVLSTAAGTQTYPGLSLMDLAEGILAFGSGLTRALLRHDRSQSKNLRLGAFRRRLRELREALHDVAPSDLKINGAPESYRAYAEHCTPKPSAKIGGRTPAKLRYESAWRAVVPGIELASTFLCGSRLVVGSSKETYCLERDTGSVLWHRPVMRGASVVTPEGLVRIGLDGSLSMHDWQTGEIALRTWSAPRAFGPPTGVVVSGPGLPRLLIMTEGDRHLIAIDLRTGDARWRYSWASKTARAAALGDSGQLRLRRHGKLLVVTAGDGALTALDVVTGQIVWRMRDHLRWCGAPNVSQSDGFALAGGQVGKARLHAFDPYSGESRWISELSGQYASTEGSVLAGKGGPVMVVRRERTGLLVEAFDRDDGARLWHTPVVAPSGTAWLVVDQRLVGNTPHGELVGLSTSTGKTVYRTRFGRIAESDIPRRLEPVLRSGALFVPHADVHVVRPEDGSVIATVGAKDAIPDLLRVDERCSVFTAEESGHIAAYAARARLSLVG